MSPEVRCGHEYGIESDYYSTSLILCDLLDADRSFLSYNNIGEISDKSLLYILIPFYNTEKSVSKTDRLTFHEMSTLFEYFFDELKDLYPDYEKELFSLDHIYQFSYYLIFNYDIYENFLFLEVASDLLEVGMNALFSTEKNYENILSLYHELMGCIAFDLEEAITPIDLFHFQKYDRGRLLYYANIIVYGQDKNYSYSECFLDFDEKIGFCPIKVIPIGQARLILCLIYHSRGISRINNYFGDPIIEEIIEILDNNF